MPFACLSVFVEVIVTGGSAGGLSTFLHLDHIASRVPNTTARVVGKPNAGFFQDNFPIRSTATSPRWYNSSWPNEMQYAFSMFNSSGSLSRECQSHHGPLHNWKCYLAPYAALISPRMPHRLSTTRSLFCKVGLTNGSSHRSYGYRAC